MGDPRDHLEARRRFNQNTMEVLTRMQPEVFMHYNEEKQFFQLLCLNANTGVVEVDEHTLVVKIDGVHGHEGETPARKAAWAVFFGPGSEHNCSGLVSDALDQTRFGADIEALERALDVVELIAADDDMVKHVIVASQSDWIVNCMTSWIQRWIDQDGCYSSGRPVEYFKDLNGLHARMDAFSEAREEEEEEEEEGGQRGFEVMFWHVPCEWMQDVNDMAYTAICDAENSRTSGSGIDDSQVDSQTKTGKEQGSATETRDLNRPYGIRGRLASPTARTHTEKENKYPRKSVVIRVHEDLNRDLRRDTFGAKTQPGFIETHLKALEFVNQTHDQRKQE